MKTFEQINHELVPSQFIKDYDLYYAHLPGEGDFFPKEKLIEHIDLVNKYVLGLIKEHRLETLIDELINGITEEEYIREFIKEGFFHLFTYHDFGKVNHLFQEKKMQNKASLFNVKHSFSSKHSFISVYIYLTHYIDKLYELIEEKGGEEELMRGLWVLLAFSAPIKKHHSSYLSNLTKEEQLFESIDELKPYLKCFNVVIKEEYIDEIIQVLDKLVPEQFFALAESSTRELYFLTKLSFSLLTASDYLATNHYMEQKQKMPFGSEWGCLTKEVKKEIIRNVENGINNRKYNKTLYDEIAKGFTFIHPKEEAFEHLNQLRKEMGAEVIQNIRKHHHENLFYIEAPTGGGKTNLSMLVLAELLRADEAQQIKKVFYVFPFTTLITQTTEALKETLGLADDQVIELHAKAGIQAKKRDDNYGGEKQDYIDYLFNNYPFTLLSHVKFFDILKTDAKEQNYLFHKLANSVIIIDEVQSYPPAEWDKIMFWLEEMAKHFCIKFVLMSATLPKLGAMHHINSKVVSLIEHKTLYFQNSNFCNRVAFDFSLYSSSSVKGEKRDVFLGQLAEKVLQESSEYANHNQVNKGSVFTIIEFIFKGTASEFYSLINAQQVSFFDEVFVLSGTILESRRREIIAYLKDHKNRTKKVLLITTQVVEAGVDIDMDLGFKDSSLIDSDEQLAGRINRNVKKKQCKLFLFNYDDASVLYGSDTRFKLMKTDLRGQHQEILSTKNFDLLYQLTLKGIDDDNNQEQVIGIDTYKESLKKMKFTDVHNDFQIISTYNKQVFVPLVLPIKVQGTTTHVFSPQDLELLKFYGKYKNKEETVNGELVWELYTEFIERKHAQNFVESKIHKKGLQAIMSHFTFSLFAESIDVEKIISAGNREEYGYLYFDLHNEYYDYQSGLKDNELDTSNFI